MKKLLSRRLKELLSPFFPTLDLDKVVLVDDGLCFGRILVAMLNASAITFWNKIYFRRGINQSTERGIGIISHELVHVAQYKEMGFFKLIIRYLGEYVKNRLRGEDRVSAYMNVCFEREAYMSEAEILKELELELLVDEKEK
jgi:hypothetical protein